MHKCMNWGAINFDWNQVRSFLATAEKGSFSAAARVLEQSQPTVGRQVAALEHSLGVTLFERVGKSLNLTSAGEELLVHVREMADVANRISITATSQSNTIEGQVRITASDVMSVYQLPPIIKQIREMAPRLEIDVVAANDLRDIQRREADIAIRHVRPTQPDLIAKLVAEANAHFYAASSYLDQVGRPKTEEDLAKLDFVGFGDVTTMIGLLNSAGIPVTAQNFRTGSKTGIVAWELVRHGLGISVMADDVAAMTPGVERVLPSREPFRFPIWLTTHSELHTARRIRLVFDHLAKQLRNYARSPDDGCGYPN
ncbi:LysR family transcriptional regulator [Ruegeria profundi]|uniref:LysR family transcriptional regulator n=1 Tax=Ruegeria profundi TaxID=1685378 RepID=UPI001CD777B1|nr:LysR family transcriptional regulator [Ruegeria profundi]MCA0927608.1 LysR family transcriptional regulator [Ruegeria profundi]